MNRSQTDSKEGFEFDGLSDHSFLQSQANESMKRASSSKHKINVNRRISIRPRPPRQKQFTGGNEEPVSPIPQINNTSIEEDQFESETNLL